MTKKVNPPLSYRVPILPTLAAVGLSLLACSKSEQRTPGVIDPGPSEFIAEEDPNEGLIEGGIKLDLSDEAETFVPIEDPPADRPEGKFVSDPREEAIPSESGVEKTLQGEVPMVPLDEKPPKVRREKPPRGRNPGGMRVMPDRRE